MQENENSVLESAYVDTRTATLHIDVTNLEDFNNLLEKAEKEARQLNDTLHALRCFDLKIKFSNE